MSCFCVFEVDGLDNAIVKLEGAARRIVYAGRQQEASDEFQVESDYVKANNTFASVVCAHFNHDFVVKAHVASNDCFFTVIKLCIVIYYV